MIIRAKKLAMNKPKKQKNQQIHVAYWFHPLSLPPGYFIRFPLLSFLVCFFTTEHVKSL
jgi:hypothetical protein